MIELRLLVAELYHDEILGLKDEARRPTGAIH
jgi:hypothetical protein